MLVQVQLANVRKAKLVVLAKTNRHAITKPARPRPTVTSQHATRDKLRLVGKVNRLRGTKGQVLRHQHAPEAMLVQGVLPPEVAELDLRLQEALVLVLLRVAVVAVVLLAVRLVLARQLEQTLATAAPLVLLVQLVQERSASTVHSWPKTRVPVPLASSIKMRMIPRNPALFPRPLPSKLLVPAHQSSACSSVARFCWWDSPRSMSGCCYNCAVTVGKSNISAQRSISTAGSAHT